MALPPSSLEDLCWPRAPAEPHMPPGLSPEQAWAWALDHFEALSSHSCQRPQACADGHSGARGLRRQASASVGAAAEVPSGQKRCREPDVQEPMAESTVDPQPPQQVCLTQPGDASARGGGQTHGQSEPWSPGRPRKLLKTQDFIWEEPGKERSPSLGHSPLQEPLPLMAWRQREAPWWGPSYCPCGLLSQNCPLHA